MYFFFDNIFGTELSDQAPTISRSNRMMLSSTILYEFGINKDI